jgi:hypothetical protein
VPSEKWKLREQEAPPKNRTLIQLDDDDNNNSDVPGEGRNNDKPDENEKAKEKLRMQAELSSLMEKIDDILKSKEVLTNKTLKTKMPG